MSHTMVSTLKKDRYLMVVGYEGQVYETGDNYLTGLAGQTRESLSTARLVLSFASDTLWRITFLCSHVFLRVWVIYCSIYFGKSKKEPA